MDEIKLKVSLEEARSIVDALHLRVLEAGLTAPAEWLRLARRIELRLVAYDYANRLPGPLDASVD